MNKDKQIDEMAKVLEGVPRWEEARLGYYRSKAVALYNAGYRKASDVVREIFEEIEKYNRPPLPECEPIYVLRKSEFAELKKKYTEEGK